jgi:hypothetical protein
MPRISGRNGAIYVALTSGGSAAPLAFTKKWMADFKTARENVTAFQDTSNVYVAGLPDASGSFDGFYDDATAQTYTAAVDGLARRFYLYPTTSSTGTYFYGTAFFDFSVDVGVDSAVTVKGTWSAASPVTKVG